MFGDRDRGGDLRLISFSFSFYYSTVFVSFSNFAVVASLYLLFLLLFLLFKNGNVFIKPSYKGFNEIVFLDAVVREDVFGS